MGIPTRPDLDGYLNGAGKRDTPPGADERELDRWMNKTLRLRLRYHHMLEDEAKKRSRAELRRMTQADLLDEILAEWAGKHGY